MSEYLFKLINDTVEIKPYKDGITKQINKHFSADNPPRIDVYADNQKNKFVYICYSYMHLDGATIDLMPLVITYDVKKELLGKAYIVGYSCDGDYTINKKVNAIENIIEIYDREANTKYKLWRNPQTMVKKLLQ